MIRAVIYLYEVALSQKRNGCSVKFNKTSLHGASLSDILHDKLGGAVTKAGQISSYPNCYLKIHILLLSQYTWEI